MDTHNLQRDTLRKYKGTTAKQKRLAELRVMYSEDNKLLTSNINKLIHVNHIFPTHLPIQASGRTSTVNPAKTNWPRACINVDCQARLRDMFADAIGNIEHEWSDACFSIRDIEKPNDDEFLVTFDHDNIEGRIHDLIVNDVKALQAHSEGFDLHTLTTCNIFGYEYPIDRRNPHNSNIDAAWRTRYSWQGKDTRVRVLAKNFNHGSKYAMNERFVYAIPDVEKYGVTKKKLLELAKTYIASKGEAWQRKLDIMERIRRDRIARSLYGFRRKFYDSSEHTAKEGFSHMVSGTVADYNHETLNLLEHTYGANQVMLHNAHDGDKIAFKYGILSEYADKAAFIAELKPLIEREISYQGRNVLLTAGIKVYL